MHLECFGLDCKKRRKRDLVRDLWQSREAKEGPRPRVTGTESKDPIDMRIKSILNTIMKRLSVDEIELLLESVKSKGRSHNQCIYTDDYGETATRTLCLAYRWPNLPRSENLRPLHDCKIPQEPMSDIRDSPHNLSRRVCVNPYHWSRIIEPQLSPTVYDTGELSHLFFSPELPYQTQPNSGIEILYKILLDCLSVEMVSVGVSGI